MIEKVSSPPASSELRRLQEAIAAEVAKEEVDYTRVIRLSTELANLDPNVVRFSVDAGIVNRLGRELVARAETAVSELIKNAYDADARTVELVFRNAEDAGGSLTIIDDGSGMTRDLLINGFMRLSSTEKVRHPVSPLYRRRRAGQKGIGRFATQRLGETLEILTRSTEDTTGYRVRIDWRSFAEGTEFGTVGIPIEDAPDAPIGTSLHIGGLREGWSDAAVRKVYRYVADLIQPAGLLPSAGVPVDETVAVDSFAVSIYRELQDQRILVADEQTEILQHAAAVITGHVGEDRWGYWTIRSDKLAIREETVRIGRQAADGEEEPYRFLQNVAFQAYHFVYRAGLLPRTLDKLIRELADERGGIRVYRNGFRVRPYGELTRGDDWLGLAHAQQARVELANVNNYNWFGYVEIRDPNNEHFIETSSREGLLQNEAFTELIDFVSRSLVAAGRRVHSVRNRKVARNQADWEPVFRSPADRVRDAAVQLDAAARGTDPDAPEPSLFGGSGERAGDPDPGLAAAARRIAAELQEAADAQETATQQLIAELGMLRVLASMGITIGEFTHEIRQTLGAAHLNARRLGSRLASGSEERQMAEDLSQNVQRFRTYASYFNRAVAENVSRDLLPQDLRRTVTDFLQVVEPAARGAGTSIESEIEGYRLLTVPMHWSEWASILFNFYSNATKAIRRTNNHGRILVRAGRLGKRVYLEFADNGSGIAPEHRDRIFDAFFTTTSPKSSYESIEDQAQGTGLGLKIVSDIVEGYGGEVFLAPPPPGFATSFRVEIPAATDEQIEAYDR